jgi:hypothetical protein
MSDKRIYTLANEAVRRRAMAAVADAPLTYRVTVEPARRNGAINAALHAKLGEIASWRVWAGKRWDIETWKRLLVAAWCRASGEQAVAMLPALDGAGVDIVYRRTSEMTQAEVRDLLAFIECWEAETETA